MDEKDKELLIRIDERVERTEKDIADIKSNIRWVALAIIAVIIKAVLEMVVIR